MHTPELRVVRDRETLRYSVHVVHIDVGSGALLGWVPTPVPLSAESSDELASLIEQLASVWERGVVDREELAGVLELAASASAPAVRPPL